MKSNADSEVQTGIKSAEMYVNYDVKSKTKKIVYCNLAMGWLIFAVTWYVLIDRFRRQTLYWCECSDCSEMPIGGIIAVIAIECILFASFGFIQTYQVLRVHLMRGYNFPPSDDQGSESISLMNEATSPKKMQALMWVQYNCIYGVLSITSKLALEFGLILLLTFST